MRLALFLLLAAAPAAALTPEQDALRRGAVERLFNLEFVESRRELDKLIALDPEDPFGYLFQAGTIWWQASAEYGLFKDTPTLEGRFETNVDAAVDKAKRLIDSGIPARRADGYFVSGMALGVRGQWNLSRGNYIKAYRDGKKAMKHLKKCVKLDPDYHDAYLGLGIFDYQTDRLPGILRVGALLMVRGDAQRGKIRIRHAAERGRLVSQQAAIFLASLLVLDEGDYAGALPIVKRLRAELPGSPYFRFVEASLLNLTGDWESSYHIAHDLFLSARNDPELLRRKQLSLLCGLLGPRCLEDPAVQATAAWLDHALPRADKEKSAPPARADSAWVTWLHLMRGVARDMLGKRELAAEDYQQALQRPDVGQAHEHARFCLEHGCTREETVRLLKSMSLRPDEVPLFIGPRPNHPPKDPEDPE